MLASHGLPGALAYLVYVGEIVAPVLLIVGLYTRPAAWIVVINMLVAIWLVHIEGPRRARQERRLGAGTAGHVPVRRLAVAFLGAGRFSVGGTGGRYN